MFSSRHLPANMMIMMRLGALQVLAVTPNCWTTLFSLIQKHICKYIHFNFCTLTTLCRSQSILSGDTELQSFQIHIEIFLNRSKICP